MHKKECEKRAAEIFDEALFKQPPPNRQLCPFCRASCPVSDREIIERLTKRADANDADAMNTLGYYYCLGDIGLPRDDRKANKLFLRAGQLGHSKAYGNLANSYFGGDGVERNLTCSYGGRNICKAQSWRVIKCCSGWI